MRPRIPSGKPALVPAILLAVVGYTYVGGAHDRSAAPATLEGIVWISGPDGGESGDDLAIDTDGTVFVTGHQSGLDTDRDGTVDVPAVMADPVLIKIAPSGDIVWIRSPTGPQYDANTRVALDRSGGAYMTGTFFERLSFEDGSLIQSAGSADAYLSRYDAAGVLLWVRTVGGAGPDIITDVASDLVGNGYVVGKGSGEFRVEGDGSTLGNGDSSPFIVSYSPRGEMRWRVLPGATGDWSLGRVEAAGDRIVVVGQYGPGDVDFDGDGNSELIGGSVADAFVARFDTNGGFIDAWSIRSPEAGPGVLGVAIDGDGDLLLAGALSGPVDFDSDGRADADVETSRSRSAFLARYNRDGVLRWARSYALDAAWDVSVAPDRIALSGFYHGAPDLNGDGRVDEGDQVGENSRDNESELAVLVLSAAGEVDYPLTAPGLGNDQARAVAFAPDRPSLYVAGFVQLTADFTPDVRDDNDWRLECDARGDLFVARYQLPEPRRITLAVSLSEAEESISAELVWSGALSADVDVFRDGTLVDSTPNDGAHVDGLGRGPLGSHTYRVCEAGSGVCSNDVKTR